MSPPTASDPDLVSRAHDSYIKEIYILVLGVGFALFASQLIPGLIPDLRAHKNFRLLHVVYFVAIYYFMAYEWVAYNLLVHRYPYRIDAAHASQGRFYCDLAALVVKASLIFVASHVDSLFHLRFVVGLFVTWHALILLWWRFARRDYRVPKGVDAVHLGMVVCYATYYFGLRYAGPVLVEDFGRLWVTRGATVLVCLTIVAFATWRKRHLIETLVPSLARL